MTSWKALLLLLFASVILVIPVDAQLIAARDNAFAVGHHHLNVTDVDAHKQFWGQLLGAEMVQFNGTDVVKLPNTLLFLRVKDPTDGSNGSSINHIGYQVPDLKALIARMKSAGFAVITREVVAAAKEDVHWNDGTKVYMAFVRAPDGLRVELIQDEKLQGTVPHHIHIFSADDAATQAWYVKHFNAKPGMRGPFKKADIPGIELTFAGSSDPLQNTKGRVLDHIGFEVDNLEAFCQKLEAAGIKLDVPFRRIDNLNLSAAFLTDPWGTYIELTEGLDKF